MGKKTF